jgi:hypothetical protein
MSTTEQPSDKLQAIRDKMDLFPNINDAWVLGGLIALSFIGIAITNVSPGKSHIYWVVMVPVFAAVSLYVRWSRLRGTGVKWLSVLKTSLLHWASFVIGVQVLYMLHRLGQLDTESIGFLVSLLLTLSVFLEGVYLDWRFYIVAFFLAMSLVLAIYMAAFMWIILFFAIVLAWVAIWFIKRKNASPNTGS